MFGLCSPRGTHFTNLPRSILRKRVILPQFLYCRDFPPESGMLLLKLEKKMTIDFLLFHEIFSICLVKLEMWRHNFKMIETTYYRKIYQKTEKG